MTGSQTPTRTIAGALTLSDVKKGAAILVTMVWLLLLGVVLSTLLTSVLTGRTPNDLGPFFALVLLVVTTPFLLFFALPNLIRDYMRQRALRKRASMATAILDAGGIVDWDTFHAVSREAFGFPDFYGRNLNAWIDCLTYLDLGDGMSRYRLVEGGILTIEVRGAADFAKRLPELALALVSATAAVNQRYAGRGKPPALALMFV